MNEATVLFLQAARERMTDDARLSVYARADATALDADEDLEATNRRLKLTIERLERLVYVDELTGLANRRFFDAALESEIRRAVRERTPLSLFLCDIDRFKRHNDRYGHRSGDAVLHAIGRVLERCCRRAGDCAARYGGEEFALILPQTRPDHAWTIAEEIRKSVEALPVGDAASGSTAPGIAAPGSAASVTLSIGVTTFDDDRSCSAGALIDAADAALYLAKNSGRNQTRFAPFEG